jgi:hypothetical protein
MSNFHWSLGYLIPSNKLNEVKRAKPFYREEEEEDNVEQFINDGALKKMRNHIPGHMFNNHWSLRYLIPSTNFKEDKRAKPFYLDEEEEEEKEEEEDDDDVVEQFIKDRALK